MLSSICEGLQLTWCKSSGKHSAAAAALFTTAVDPADCLLHLQTVESPEGLDTSDVSKGEVQVPMGFLM